MSTLAWGIAGALSAYSAILLRPSLGFSSTQALGPELLLRALTAAVVARMSNLPVALLAGIGVGVIEEEVLWNYPNSGVVDVVLFFIIMICLLFQRTRRGRVEDAGAWVAMRPWRIPRLGTVATRRYTRLVWSLAVAGVALAVVVGAVATASATVTLSFIGSFAIVGLSVGIITGLNGQLSLGQFALAGIGATVCYIVMSHTGSNYFLGFVAAAIATAAVSVVIGLPALRIRGLMLAVATLAFALAASSWLFQQSWMLGTGVTPSRKGLEGAKSYYLFSLGVVLICIWLARNIWVGGIGRQLRALRDNETAARAFAIRNTALRLQGFAIAGALAGLGGALYGQLLSFLSPDSFDPSSSIDVVAMAALGGLGIVLGPVFGAFYIIGIPQFLPLDNAGIAATALGWLALIVYRPGGIAQLIAPGWEKLIAWVSGQPATSVAQVASAPLEARSNLARFRELFIKDAPAAATSPAEGTSSTARVILEARELRKRYGGVNAVDGMDLSVRAGETVGLIGPNGAGKTTLFEILGGFTRADAGVVMFNGRDITSFRPEDRARIGLVRSFQDAALFPTLTVLETLQLAQERRMPTRPILSFLGRQSPDRRKRARAGEIADLMGLGPFADRQISELSTGTRRIAELACVLTLEPKLLLLDEPSAGIAQRETEALGRLLTSIKIDLDLSLVIIEHDIPLVMSLADRVVAMEAGRQLAEGSPEEIRHSEAVIDSYLGTNWDAIARSDTVRVKADDA
jgi:ABC-type branched-subunit amino acid transport system ATPase component/ABC-type branched-subunit amino acid transport system permease subunit